MGIVEAVVASAIIGAAGSAYAASEQKKAQREATAAQERARREAEAEAERVARETRPTERSATLEIGGTDSIGTDIQSTADFLIPKSKSLGSSGGSGLGFSV